MKKRKKHKKRKQIKKSNMRIRLPNVLWRSLDMSINPPLMEPEMKRPAILVERETTHGNFAKNAQVSQDIKTILRTAGYLSLDPVQIEALDMIALKISRIVSGKATVKDHWDDVAGYANIAGEVCE